LRVFAATALVPALLIGPMPGHAQETETLVEKGRAISRLHCSRCHVIDGKKPFGGISSTPSFTLIIKALADWEDRFATFHARRPHPAIVRFKGEPIDPEYPPSSVPIEIDPDDIEAILAFVRTLKKAD